MSNINKPLLEELNTINIFQYSPKSIVLVGENTKPIKDELREMGGGYNCYLKDDDGKIFKGWIFPKSQLDKVKEYLETIEFIEE